MLDELGWHMMDAGELLQLKKEYHGFYITYTVKIAQNTALLNSMHLPM